MRRASGEHGTPGVANSDQGPVFGPGEYVGLLREAGVPQGMDGRGRWADNAVMERRLGTLKTECVRLAGYPAPAQPRGLIGEFAGQHDERGPASRRATGRRRSGIVRGWRRPRSGSEG